MLKQEGFIRRQKRSRFKLIQRNKAGHLRLSVFRSNRHIYGQIIDDAQQTTILSVSSAGLKLANGGDKLAAQKVGEILGQKAQEKGITHIIFDKGGYLYHGRIKILADAARQAGLKF